MEAFDGQRAGARILVVATEWHSRHGGLSTFNRELCVALAHTGQQVVCLVPGADIEEIADARARGVALIKAVAELGAEDLVRLRRRPPLGALEPEVIIGHGRITGPAARALCEDLFPHARRVHVVHTFPPHIEWYKDAGASATRMTKAAAREALERDLAESADLVAAVGPLLARETSGMLGRQVLELLPGIEPRERGDGLPVTVRCLLSGRVEDPELKGLDIAARAFARLNVGSAPERPLLVVQGALDDGDALAEKLARLAGGRPKVHVAPYTPDPNQLAHEMARASLAIMPSRREGFGLVGLDAIGAGVPVLVSANSGLGETLGALGGAAARCVVDVEDVEDRDAQRWAEAIQAIIDDRPAAFTAAREVRRQVAERCAWPACAQVLLAELGLTADAAAPAPPPAPVVMLPQRDGAFFGRAALLGQVDEAFGDPERPAVLALVGRPGSGRGAVALEAAWRRRQLYDTVWSVVGPPEALEDSLAKLADALGLAECEPVEQAAEAAVRWLGGHGRWMLLLDGTGVAERLAQRTPERLSGHVLIVGEVPHAWASGATAVEVGPFTADESVELLLARGGDPDGGAVRELAEALGGRPLAVTTAAAYLDEGAYTVRQLLERLRVSAPGLFGDDAGSATAVVEMLRLAHEELSRHPLAVEALYLAAFMGEGPIPVGLIGGEKFVALGEEAQAEGDLAVGEVALGTAERFSQLVRSGRTVRLHPEVAHRTRQQLGDEAGVWAAEAVRTVLRALQSEDEPAVHTLFSHALAATEHAMQRAQSVAVVGLHAQVTALRLRAAGLLTDAGELTAAETALAAVADFLASWPAAEDLDPELIVAVGRARGRLARLDGDEVRAQAFEDEALAVARVASMRPPVLAGVSCELLLAVLEESPFGSDDPWYCALDFRSLQASGSVLSEAEWEEPAEVRAAVELRSRVAAHLAQRGQYEDVVAVAEAALAVTPAESLRTAVAALGELAAVALETLGEIDAARQHRSRVADWAIASARP